MRPAPPIALVAIAVATLAATGCGLKAALEMPPKSSNVVIRGPQQVEPSPGNEGATPGATTPQPVTPSPAPPPEERLPPPPLPGGNPGSSSGG
jgi:predicted small lipoprotein YifL